MSERRNIVEEKILKLLGVQLVRDTGRSGGTTERATESQKNANARATACEDSVRWLCLTVFLYDLSRKTQ